MMIDETPRFKVGDPCPEGYVARYDWAMVHYRAGLKQQRCSKCGLWKFPHEFSDKVVARTELASKTLRGKKFKIQTISRYCKDCAR